MFKGFNIVIMKEIEENVFTISYDELKEVCYVVMLFLQLTDYTLRLV